MAYPASLPVTNGAEDVNTFGEGLSVMGVECFCIEPRREQTGLKLCPQHV